jgi:L-arabinose isomerase
MLDMYSDFTMHQAQLGAHIEVLEMDDLIQRVRGVESTEIDAKILDINEIFDIAEPGKDAISRPVTEDALRWSAQVSVGLDRLVEDFDLGGLTYYYRGLDGNENEELGSTLIIGNSLLTARGIPASGEGDLKTCMAMFIMDRLGSGGSFTEFYAMDFNEDFILMGHDGPGHVAISAGRPLLRGLGLFHGKRGYGLSVEFNVRNGPVTILGLTQTAGGRLKLIAAQGECIPGTRMAIGNTNSRLDFGRDPASFMDSWCAHGPTHHVALGIGHRIEPLRKLARLLDIELAVV